jgi:hypothetical protein
VHTIGAALFADKDEIHFFKEIGYEHYPFTHCPQGEMWERGRCSCEQERNFGTSRDTAAIVCLLVRVPSLMVVCTDYHMGWSCLPKWDQVKDIRQEL